MEFIKRQKDVKVKDNIETLREEGLENIPNDFIQRLKCSLSSVWLVKIIHYTCASREEHLAEWSPSSLMQEK